MTEPELTDMSGLYLYGEMKKTGKKHKLNYFMES